MVLYDFCSDSLILFLLPIFVTLRIYVDKFDMFYPIRLSRSFQVREYQKKKKCMHYTVWDGEFTFVHDTNITGYCFCYTIYVFFPGQTFVNYYTKKFSTLDSFKYNTKIQYSNFHLFLRMSYEVYLKLINFILCYSYNIC